ncbi:MAG: Arc family DNA binding domain-containing protein [Cyanobacteria bacterium PR.3.49]|nr:Arc family DNA binding domain-containing protein [Cyanobacteria bacterium PR.3.49]
MARKSFLLRIEKQLYDDIESWAQQEMRSVNGQIEYILRQAALKYRSKGQILDVRATQKTQKMQNESGETSD